MQIIKTKSFELAVNTAGDSDSSKVAIVIPGRLDSKDYAHNVSHIKYLAERGYFALSFDPPGAWESPGGLEIYTTTNYIKAVNELIENLGNRPTLLMGHSRGGTIAMLVGTTNPHVSHIITMMSYYGQPNPPTEEDKIKGFRVVMRDLPPGDKENDPNQRRFELPLIYFKDGENYDATLALKNSSVPKLFFYGTLDTMHDPEDTKKMYEFSATPKFIHELKSKHDYRRYPVIIEEVNHEVGKFLDRN